MPQPCLGFAPAEVSPHRKCRLFVRACCSLAIVPRIVLVGPSWPCHRRFRPTPDSLVDPPKETVRASPRDPERSRLRRTSRFHLSDRSRPLSGELPHSPADYGLPFRSPDPAITGHAAKPSRSPWARSIRATAQIRFTSLRSFAFCESVHARGGCPTPHGRSSLGCFASLKLSPPTPWTSNPRKTCVSRAQRPSRSASNLSNRVAPIRAASQRPGVWPLGPSPAGLSAALDARLATRGPLSPLAG